MNEYHLIASNDHFAWQKSLSSFKSGIMKPSTNSHAVIKSEELAGMHSCVKAYISSFDKGDHVSIGFETTSQDNPITISLIIESDIKLNARVETSLGDRVISVKHLDSFLQKYELQSLQDRFNLLSAAEKESLCPFTVKRSGHLLSIHSKDTSGYWSNKTVKKDISGFVQSHYLNSILHMGDPGLTRTVDKALEILSYNLQICLGSFHEIISNSYDPLTDTAYGSDIFAHNATTCNIYWSILREFFKSDISRVMDNASGNPKKRHYTLTQTIKKLNEAMQIVESINLDFSFNRQQAVIKQLSLVGLDAPEVHRLASWMLKNSQKYSRFVLGKNKKQLEAYKVNLFKYVQDSYPQAINPPEETENQQTLNQLMNPIERVLSRLATKSRFSNIQQLAYLRGNTNLSLSPLPKSYTLRTTNRYNLISKYDSGCAIHDRLSDRSRELQKVRSSSHTYERFIGCIHSLNALFCEQSISAPTELFRKASSKIVILDLKDIFTGNPKPSHLTMIDKSEAPVQIYIYSYYSTVTTAFVLAAAKPTHALYLSQYICTSKSADHKAEFRVKTTDLSHLAQLINPSKTSLTFWSDMNQVKVLGKHLVILLRNRTTYFGPHQAKVMEDTKRDIGMYRYSIKLVTIDGLRSTLADSYESAIMNPHDTFAVHLSRSGIYGIVINDKSSMLIKVVKAKFVQICPLLNMPRRYVSPSTAGHHHWSWQSDTGRLLLWRTNRSPDGIDLAVQSFKFKTKL